MPGVCFHGEKSCGFCGFPVRVDRTLHRCAVCGRFRPKVGPHECGRCRERGFRALRLPFPRIRRRTAA